MRLPKTLLLFALLFALALLPSCTFVDARTYDLRTGRESTVDALAREMCDMDVVFLGEAHGNPHGHELQLKAIKAFHRLRPDMAISLEMVERDQQEALDLYLSRRTSEAAFLVALKSDKRSASFFEFYKPIFDHASIYEIDVIAANVPRPLAARVWKEGLDAVAGEKYMPAQTSAPKDAYWDAFKEAFSDQGHGSSFTEEQLYRYYQAQCVKDDAMAESIAGHIEAQRKQGRSPLVVHLCGAFHSDHGRGTVARLRQRLPRARIGIVSTKTNKHVSKPAIEAGLADFLWVVREVPQKKPKPASMPASMPTSMPAGHPTTRPTSGPASQPVDTEASPGLNFLPVYGPDRELPGVEIDAVSEGGAAAKAGLEAGDVILKIDDHLLKDLRTYMEVLSGYRPGDRVTLTVVRGKKSLKVKATIGVSHR